MGNYAKIVIDIDKKHQLQNLQLIRLTICGATLALDVMFIYLGIWSVSVFYLKPKFGAYFSEISLISIPIFVMSGLNAGLYSIDAINSFRSALVRLAQALATACTTVVLFVFASKLSDQFSRLGFVIAGAVAFALLVALRVLIWRSVRRHTGGRLLNELVIHDGGPPIDLPGAHHVCARELALVPSLYDPHALDRIGAVLRNADRVVVSTPDERREFWAIVLQGANVAGEVVDETVARMRAIGARSVGGQGLLQVSVGPLGIRSRFAKRMLDLGLAMLGIALLAVPLALIALLIRLEDGGPVLFVQRRVGRGNQFFAIYKFRTMRANPDGIEGARSTARDDARVTKIGRVLRATSIDELPQLFNVLKGDMSLVGPRPHAIGSQAGDKLFWEIDARYWTRHALRPGLTGLAQIRGLRGATDHEDELAGRLAADLEYLNGWSLWRDLRIIALTLRVLIHRQAF